MGFKEKLRDSKNFNGADRALMYAVKMFSANSIIPGALITPDGKKAKLSPIFNRKMQGLTLHAQMDEIIKMVHSVMVFPDFAKEHDVEYRLEGFEQFRKTNGFRKSKFADIAEDFIETLGIDHSISDEIIDYYETKQSGRDWNPIEAVKELGFGKNEKLVTRYLERFSTKNQFDQGKISKSKRAVDAMKELKRMMNQQVFHYNGVGYDVSKHKIVEALEQVIKKDDLFHLKNNNYLKVILKSWSDVSIPDEDERLRAAVEGY